MGVGPKQPSHPRNSSRFTRASRIASAAVVAIGVMVCIGWLADIAVLQRLHPSFASMKLNTALSLIALGLAAGAASERPRLRRVLVAIAMAIAGATLLEYATGVNLGIDQLLVDDPAASAAPGRMAPATTICLLVLAAAAWWVDALWAQWLALLAALFAHVAVLGYLYGVRDLYRIGPYSTIAIHTAVALYAMALALLLARSDRGLIGLAAGDTPGGVLARRLLPAAIVLPALLALVRQWGEQAGLYGPGFGRAMLVASNSVILIALIWQIAAALARADEQRRAAELAVRESEARKAAVLESALDAILVVDSSAHILELNAAGVAMFGQPRDKLVGTALADAIAPPAARAAGTARLGRIASGQSSMVGARNEMTAYRADGSEFPVEISMTHVREADPPMFTVLLRDVSEQKRARADLMRSHDRLRVLAGVSDAFARVATTYEALLEKIARTIADLIGDGCMVTLISDDGERLVNAANAHRDPALEEDYRTYLAHVGVSRTSSPSVSAAVARTGEARRADVKPADMVAQAEEALRPLVARLAVHGFAVVPIRTGHTVIGTLSLVRSRPGRGYTDDDLTLLQDLADRAGLAIENARLFEQLEQRVRERTAELEASNQQLEAFSVSAAHDLRAPLRAISGFSGALVEDCAERLGADGLRYATHIRDAASRMSNLINDLLEMSRITRSELRRARVDVTALARMVVAGLRAGQPAREVEVAIAPSLTAFADPRLVEVVFTNLLDNAWKFTGKRDRPRIDVETVAGERPTVYVVRDNGAGFDPATTPALFGVFQRFHPADQFEGTGIGLATVQRIIQRHGGRIWAEAEVGRGATFYFTLESPRTTATGQAASPRSPS